jgi:hypothetical protein
VGDGIFACVEGAEVFSTFPGPERDAVQVGYSDRTLATGCRTPRKPKNRIGEGLPVIRPEPNIPASS